MKNQQAPEIYALHTVPNEGEKPWLGIYAVRADAEHDAKVMHDVTGRDWSVVRLVVADTAATPTGPITRYEVVDCIDSKHVPAVIPNGAGPWVRYEDHAAALCRLHAENEALRTQQQECGNPPYDEGPFALAQPVAQRGAADGFFLLLPQRPKPEAPAGTAGLDWDAYSGAQMLAFGRDCSDAAIAALRTQQPAPATLAVNDDLRDRLVAISEAIADQDDRAAQAMLREILAAPQPSPTTQANRQPAPVAQGDALTDTYVQQVPDKCDRIVWRGRYYHLPIDAAEHSYTEPSPMAKVAAALRQKAEQEDAVYQARRSDQGLMESEWGPMEDAPPHEDPPMHVAVVEGDDTVRTLQWNRDVAAFAYPAGTLLYTDRAARAQADSVLEDAARYRWLADYLIGERTDLDEGIVACATIDALRQFVDSARKQGANHDNT